MRNPQPSPPPLEVTRFGLPELDPEGRPWSQLTFLILRHRAGEISLDELMREAMPVIRRVARHAGSVRRLAEEAEEIAQELAILLCTDLHRAFDPRRADAMSMLTTYARSVARTEERRAERRPLALDPSDERLPAHRDPLDFTTGLSGSGAARDGDDDPYFAHLDQVLAQRRIASALIDFPAPATDRLPPKSESKGRRRLARDGVGDEVTTMSILGRKAPSEVVASLPVVPTSLGALEVVERRGVPRALRTAGERLASPKEGKPPKRPISAAQKRLRDTRKRLGYTSKDFARLLNIGAPRLASYEYGVTATVPKEIMERLDAIAAKHADQARALASFGRKLIGTIVGEWEKELRPFVRQLHGIEGAPNEPLPLRDLALELKVNPVTLKRWYSNQTRPPETRIAAVDEHVRKRLSQHKARLLKQRLASGK